MCTSFLRFLGKVVTAFLPALRELSELLDLSPGNRNQHQALPKSRPITIQQAVWRFTVFRFSDFDFRAERRSLLQCRTVATGSRPDGPAAQADPAETVRCANQVERSFVAARPLDDIVSAVRSPLMQRSNAEPRADAGLSARSTASPSSSKALDSERPSPATPQRSFPTPPHHPDAVKELDDGDLTPAAAPTYLESRHIATDSDGSEGEDDSDGYVTASEGEEALDDVASLEKAAPTQAEPNSSPTSKDGQGAAMVPGAAAAAVARRPLGKPMSQLTAADVSLTPEDIKEDIRIIWEAL